MAISKYETIMLEEKLKEQILSHYRILHAEKLTPVSVLEVISTKHPSVYKSFIVMIDTPRSTQYKVLLYTEGKRSVSDTLEHLLLSLRQKLALPLDQLVLDADEERSFWAEAMEGYH
ncbi:hypothetical protein GT037_004923 [Alternaria burnsii]|uniref:Uncharacterized protein n=1 Tax=Alternaria burnsii TaxID=1187904 RepID=A0A8H7B7D9_9PLEO|nr:uncharacterized protein GT037_004923 [Alternaria burnsii]KAF7676711.1 hypothetical protein GT037_004923 [Alternaria burnsii]